MSQSQENLKALTLSQENILRKPRVADKHQQQHNNLNMPGGGSLTFGAMKPGALKNTLGANREFQEEKKIKNEVLDDIIRNASRNNTKSQDFGRKMPRAERVLHCANH